MSQVDNKHIGEKMSLDSQTKSAVVTLLVFMIVGIFLILLASVT